MTETVTTTRVGYGARPVSIDIARGRPLLEFIDNTSQPDIAIRSSIRSPIKPSPTGSPSRTGRQVTRSSSARWPAEPDGPR